MASECSECGELKDSQRAPMWKCDLCNNYTCQGCSGFGATEVSCMELKKRTLVYCCPDCKEVVVCVPDLARAVKNIQSKMGKARARDAENSTAKDALDSIAESLAGIQRDQADMKKSQADMKKSQDDMKKNQADMKTDLEEITAVKTEIVEIKHYVKSLLTASDYEQLKISLLKDNEELQSEVRERLQGLPSAEDYSELKATVEALQNTVEELRAAPKSNGGISEVEVIAESLEQQKGARNVIVTGVEESSKEAPAARMEMSSNDSNCPFCPGEASVPRLLLSNKENRTCAFPQHPPAMADHPHVRFLPAIRQGELETVKSLLDLYGLPHMVNRLPRCSFLCESLLYHHEDIAKLLIEHGAEINALTSRRSTPLHLATWRGYTVVVSMLLEKGALVNAKDYDGNSSLYFAVAGEQLEIIKLLLNEMADIEVRPWRDDMTPLHFAVKSLGDQSSKVQSRLALASRCQQCVSSYTVEFDTDNAMDTNTSREEVVRLLLDRGADVDALDKNEDNVLSKAFHQSNFRIIEHILLSRPEASLNGSGLHISRNLHDAVRNGCTRIVEDLLMQGATVEVRHESAHGGTLLHSAAASRRMSMAEFLVERGADVNAKDKNSKTPILYAVENMDPAMTRLFLTNGANDQGRPNLLHTAAEQGCSHIMEMILDHFPYIDVDAVENVDSTFVHSRFRFDSGIFGSIFDQNRKKIVTALHVAAAKGFARVVELLLDHNANIDSFAETVGTPLHCAVLQTDGAVVDMLLVKGAEVDADRGDGTTPLHFAVREGNATAFDLLIKHGADIHKKNNDGRNLVHIAIPDDHLRMFEADLLDVFMAGHPLTNSGHLSALDIAIILRDPTGVEILLRNGADASVRYGNSSTSLHNAFHMNFFKREIAEALLNSLDDIDVRNGDGETALHIAGTMEMVRLLLFHGSDVNVEDYFGRTPLNAFRKRSLRQSDDDGNADIRFNEYEIVMHEHIVKMLALGLDVNNKNMRFIDVSSLHKDLYDKCHQEVQSLRITRIGESEISFYEFLTTGKDKLAFYSRNPDIAKVLERGDYKNTFELYCDMIESRFRKKKIMNDLVHSSVRYLKVLSGYSLTDDVLMEIVRYLDRQDLRNVILAGARDEKLKK